MNPLTHAYFALELFKGEKITPLQRDHLIVGSILPDISQLGLINFYRTHTQGEEFLRTTKRSLDRYLAWGIISHGEDPPGLDYHAHKERGYINLKQKVINPILRKYQKNIGKINNKLAHHLIEFSVDYLVAQKDPSLIKKVELAFRNPQTRITATNFFQFLGLSEKKIRKINTCLSRGYLFRFFRNFQSTVGLVNNWLNFRFYYYFKQGKHLPFREKIKKLTQFSFYNLKRKVKNKPLINLFNEVTFYLRKDYHSFLSKTQKEVASLKEELFCSSRTKK